MFKIKEKNKKPILYLVENIFERSELRKETIHIHDTEDSNHFCGLFLEYRGTMLEKGLTHKKMCQKKFCRISKRNRLFDCCYCFSSNDTIYFKNGLRPNNSKAIQASKEYQILFLV